MKYRWVPGKDTSDSPIYETLAKGTPMDMVELVTATGMSKTDVIAHLTQGLRDGMIRPVAVETVRPVLRPSKELPSVPLVPEKVEKKASEVDMVSFLLGKGI